VEQMRRLSLTNGSYSCMSNKKWKDIQKHSKKDISWHYC
jgi:hypothetical protein